jgi:probable rRNA maturation factor
MINTVVADPFTSLIDSTKLEKAALAVLKHQQAPLESDLSIVIEDDAYLHQLNLEFLKVDAPTDVLSFSAGEDEVDPETGQAYLGDVILSSHARLNRPQPQARCTRRITAPGGSWRAASAGA